MGIGRPDQYLGYYSEGKLLNTQIYLQNCALFDAFVCTKHKQKIEVQELHTQGPVYQKSRI